MKQKNSILVVYPPGGYGTFVEWCLNYFAGKIPIDALPFTDNGSSHQAQGCYSLDLRDSLNMQQYLASDHDYCTVRTHAISKGYEHIKDLKIKLFIDSISEYFSKIVLLNPDFNTWMLLVNNRLTKIPTETPATIYQKIINTYKDQFQSTDNPPPWQIREMISYQYESDYQLYVNTYSAVDSKNIINVSIRNLVDDFKTTLIKMFNDLGLELTRPEEIVPVQQEWLSLQYYLDRDQLCHRIVESAVTGQEFNWKHANLALYEEAFVQWQLRVLHNKDLLCYGLDQFPTNTTSLIEKLVNTNLT
jgi:hypothetical protein